jgi:hypothetical protein
MTVATYEHAKKTFVCVTQVIILLVMLDMMILSVSLAQIMTEGQSGYWNPFWLTQAQMVSSIFR